MIDNIVQAVMHVFTDMVYRSVMCCAKYNLFD